MSSFLWLGRPWSPIPSRSVGCWVRVSVQVLGVVRLGRVSGLGVGPGVGYRSRGPLGVVRLGRVSGTGIGVPLRKQAPVY